MKLSWNFKFALGTIALVTVVLGGVFLYAIQLMGLQSVKKELLVFQQGLQSQVHTLNDKITALTTKEPAISIKDFENWSLYSERDSFPLGNCYGPAEKFVANNARGVAKEGPFAATLMITPNFGNWTNEKFFKAYNEALRAPGSDCDNVGAMEPLNVYSDKILWIAKGGCGEPDLEASSTGYGDAHYQQCIEEQKYITEYFKK